MNPQEPTRLVRLHGVPCSVCEYPADGMVIHPNIRTIHHVARFVAPCVLPNPPKPEPIVVPAVQQPSAA